MKPPIRFGILSFAHYHANFWAESVVEHPNATLVGVWDDDAKRGADGAATYGTEFEPNLDRLLEQCDAIGITSETAKHADLVEAAAAHGCHIICEKPLATNLEDADRIEQAVRSSGVSFMQNLPKRFDPINSELRQTVENGDLGKITLLRIRHGHFHGLDPDFHGQWYVDPSLGGGGTLIDEGVHAADFVLWLMGAPMSVQATSTSSTLGLDVEDTAAATVYFRNGAIAEIATGWTFVAAEQSVELFGTEGTAILGGVDLASKRASQPPYLRVFSHASETWSGSPTIPAFVTGDFHQRGPRVFIDDLLAGRIPEPGLAEGRASLSLILAAYQSIASGRVQQLSQE